MFIITHNGAILQGSTLRNPKIKEIGTGSFSSEHVAMTYSNIKAGAGGWQLLHDVALVTSDVISFGQGPFRFISALAQATDLASEYYANLIYGVVQ